MALLSLMLPSGTPLTDIDALLDGVLEMAAAAGITVAGGNITRSPGPLVVDVTVTGHVRPRRVLTRAGGRPGDGLYVTGSIGAAAAGLEWLNENFRSNENFRLKAEDPIFECVLRHRRPEPRLRIGAMLGRTRTASACMDLSDGLADAIPQVTRASGTGAKVDAAALPIHPGAAAWFTGRGRDPVQAALSGGDDYELLFTVKPKSAGRLRALAADARGVKFTRIGELTKDASVVLLRDEGPEPLPAGFAHF